MGSGGTGAILAGKRESVALVVVVVVLVGVSQRVSGRHCVQSIS